MQNKGINKIKYNINFHPDIIALEKRITPYIMNINEYNTIISSIKNKDEKYLWHFAREFPISLYYTIKNNMIEIEVLPYEKIKEINIYDPTVNFFWRSQNLIQLKQEHYLTTDTSTIKNNMLKQPFGSTDNIIINKDLEKMHQFLDFCVANNVDNITFRRILNNFEQE